MTSIFKRGTAVGIVALLALVGAVGATAARTAGAGQTAAAAGMNVDWPLLGNTSGNTRYSTLTQINTGNVSQLGLAWTMQEGTGQSTFEDFPVVVKGVMYVITNLDQVRALNAATGKLIWQYTPKVNFYEAIAGGGGGVPTARGVEVANGKVYMLTFDNQLIALQAATGEKLWDTSVANAADGNSETSPPTYWNGLLFVGSAESDSGERGFVAAYNANTGKQVWKFYTVPAPGQGWMPKAGAHGGGDVWMPQVIDTKTGILYFGTGNPSPDFDNRQRPGCDPYVDSTVALNARTGKLIWAHTEVCPDVWDYDSHQQPMIFDFTMNGKTVHAVGHGNKSSLYYVYDAATGKVLSDSGHLSYYTMPHRMPNTKGVLVCPGTGGGFEYDPPAFSPQTQLIYIDGSNACEIMSRGPENQANAHTRGAIDVNGSISFPKYNPTGYLAALNPATGKVMWRVKRSKPMIGGVMATAGNLVFTGADDGYFYAMDARTGKILWSANLGLAFGAPPITYEVNGTQYVAIAVGGGSGRLQMGGDELKTPSGGTLAVFKLHGSPVHKLPAVNAGAVPTSAERPSTKGLTKINPWMYVDKARHHLVLILTAAATTTNNGFNFDGYDKGKATFIVPQGWTVDWIFSNKSAIAHSAALLPVLKSGAQPVVVGIAPVETPDPQKGTGAGQQEYVSFGAQKAGNYYLVCLVPGHLQSGMWDRFNISSTATMPSIQVK